MQIELFELVVYCLRCFDMKFINFACRLFEGISLEKRRECRTFEGLSLAHNYPLDSPI